jgi:hypothetical protein
MCSYFQMNIQLNLVMSNLGYSKFRLSPILYSKFTPLYLKLSKKKILIMQIRPILIKR